MEEEYLRAVKDPRLRKEFLEKINLGPVKDYIRKVKYKHIIPTQKKGYLVMEAFAPPRTSFLIPGGKSRIFVYETAFFKNVHENFHDFYNTLVYHEGKHAEQYFTISDSLIHRLSMQYHQIPRDICNFEMELEATINQLENLNPKNSNSFKKGKISDLFNLERKVLKEYLLKVGLIIPTKA